MVVRRFGAVVSNLPAFAANHRVVSHRGRVGDVLSKTNSQAHTSGSANAPSSLSKFPPIVTDGHKRVIIFYGWEFGIAYVVFFVEGPPWFP